MVLEIKSTLTLEHKRSGPRRDGYDTLNHSLKLHFLNKFKKWDVLGSEITVHVVEFTITDKL